MLEAVTSLDGYGSLALAGQSSKEARLSRRSVLETPGLIALSGLATLVAALVGTICGVILTFPFSLIALIIFPIIIGSFVLAMVLAAPVTLILFPLTWQLLRGHPIVAQLVIPAVGFVAGGAIISGWTAVGVLPHDPGSSGLFTAIGMVSGLSGGGFFVRGLYV